MLPRSLLLMAPTAPTLDAAGTGPAATDLKVTVVGHLKAHSLSGKPWVVLVPKNIPDTIVYH